MGIRSKVYSGNPLSLRACYYKNMNQRVIVLRGTPASGKSTIAKSYRNFEEKFAWIKVDNFKDFFADDSTPALEYVNGSAIATLEYLLDQGFSVIIEGVFQNPRTMEIAFSASVSRGIPCMIFELETPLDVLKQRDNERSGKVGAEVIERIYHTLKETQRTDSIKLDTADNSLDECRKIIDQSFESWGKNDKEFNRAVLDFLESGS